MTGKEKQAENEEVRIASATCSERRHRAKIGIEQGRNAEKVECVERAAQRSSVKEGTELRKKDRKAADRRNRETVDTGVGTTSACL